MNLHAQKEQQRRSTHFNQRPQICHNHHKLLCVTALFMTRSITNGPHPVLLNMTNNASTLSWTNHICRKSTLGRLLARFFYSLLIISPLGINSQWISTDDNKIADDSSQIKRHHLTDLILLTIPLCTRCTWSWLTALSCRFSQSKSCWNGTLCWPRNGQLTKRYRSWNGSH